MKSPERNQLISKVSKWQTKRNIRKLIKTLSVEDNQVKKMVLKALVQIGDDRSVKPIISLLNDKDFAIRTDSLEALREFKDSRAEKPIIELILKNKSFFGSVEAIRTLGYVGSQESIQLLMKAILSHQEEIRKEASESLGLLGEPIWKEYIFGDEGDYLRLAESGNPRAFQLMCDFLDDSNSYDLDKYEIVRAFGVLGTDHGIDKLIEVLLNSTDSKFRIKILDALSKTKNIRVVNPITSTLSDESIQKYSIIALGEIGDVEAVEVLISSLLNENIRCEAAEALGKIGDDRAVEPLIKTLENDKPVSSMVEKNSPVTAESMDKQRNYSINQNRKNKEYLEVAITALGQFGDKRAVGILNNILQKNKYYNDQDLKNLIIKVLCQFGDISSLELIIKNIDYYSVEHLVSSYEQKAIIPLINCLNNPNGVTEFEKYDRKRVYIKALSLTGDRQIIDLLNSELEKIAIDRSVKHNSSTWLVISEIAKVLGYLGSITSVDPLIKVLDAEDVCSNYVRPRFEQYRRPKIDIINALGKIGDIRAVEPLLKICSKGTAIPEEVLVNSLKELMKSNPDMELDKHKEISKEISKLEKRIKKKIAYG